MTDTVAGFSAIDYAARAWPDLSPLNGHAAHPSSLVARVRRMLAGAEPEDAELLDWIRHDIPTATESPEELYARVATGGPGEAIFKHGLEALSATGYGRLADGVHPWSVTRFRGLGCPWLAGLPEPGETVVDIGCGSGVDVAVAAAAVGEQGKVIGVDIRRESVPPRPATVVGTSFVVAQAHATTLPDASAGEAIANGLPTLMSTRTAPDVLREIHRVLRPGGRARAIILVTGPDRETDELDALTVLNAVRCGKPICARVRELFAAAAFTDVTLTALASPFASGFRPGPVAAVLVTGRRA